MATKIDVLVNRIKKDFSNKKFVRGQIDISPADFMKLVKATGDGMVSDGNFEIDSENEDQFHALCLWFSGNPDFNKLKKGNDLNKGLMIQGSVGAGKSIAVRIFIDIIERFNLSGLIGGSPRMVSTHTVCNDIETLGIAETKKYINYNWYCFDDLGDEPLEVQPPYKSTKVEAFRRIISERYEKHVINGQITIATTNFNFDMIDKYYGVRVGSRCRQMFNPIALVGKDRRKIT